MGVLDEFAQYQQQIQEINAVRAQNMSSGSSADHSHIVYNTQRNIAIKRAQDSANSVQQYKSWMQRTFQEQSHRTSKIQEAFERTEYRLNKTINQVADSMKNVTRDIMDAFSPEHLAETTTGQFRTFMYLLGTSAIATNIDKITGWVKKIAGFFGIGDGGDGTTLESSLSELVTGESGHSILESLKELVKAPIDYLINWIKGEFELRSSMMNKVKMPEFNQVSLGGLPADLIPFGNLLQSVSSYFSDVMNSFGQKLEAFFNPSNMGEVMGNNVIQANAKEVRELKASSMQSENETGTLYKYDGNNKPVKSNNTVNFIPKTFLNAAGGLNGSVGSMLAGSRQVYSLYHESSKGGRIDTSSLVDTLNKLYRTTKQKGYIIVEASFLNSFPESAKKYKNPEHEVIIYCVKGNLNVLETIGLGITKGNKSNETYYLTEDDWNRLGEEGQKELKVLGTVVSYKLTEEEFNEFARDNYNVDNFDSMQNSTLIRYAQSSLESVKNTQLDERFRNNLIRQVGEDRMDDKGIENIYVESQSAYEEADHIRREKLENSESAQILKRVGNAFSQAVRKSEWNTEEGKEKAEWIRKNSSIIHTILGGKSTSISSYWGEGRENGKRSHNGIDFPIPENTEIYAPENGIIDKINNQNTGNGGKYIYLTSEDGHRRYFFCHLNKITRREQESVKKGDLIGYSGNTGVGTGPHLHFEVIVDNVKVDPLEFIQSEEGMDYEKGIITSPKNIEIEETTSPLKKMEQAMSNVKFTPLKNSDETITTKTANNVATSVQSIKEEETNSARSDLQKIQTGIEVKKAAIEVIGLAGEELSNKIDLTNQLLSSKQNSKPVEIRKR